jgi:hypothetical protein
MPPEPEGVWIFLPGKKGLGAEQVHGLVPGQDMSQVAEADQGIDEDTQAQENTREPSFTFLFMHVEAHTSF